MSRPPALLRLAASPSSAVASGTAALWAVAPYVPARTLGPGGAPGEPASSHVDTAGCRSSRRVSLAHPIRPLALCLCPPGRVAFPGQQSRVRLVIRSHGRRPLAGWWGRLSSVRSPTGLELGSSSCVVSCPTCSSFRPLPSFSASCGAGEAFTVSFYRLSRITRSPSRGTLPLLPGLRHVTALPTEHRSLLLPLSHGSFYMRQKPSETLFRFLFKSPTSGVMNFPFSRRRANVSPGHPGLCCGGGGVAASTPGWGGLYRGD